MRRSTSQISCGPATAARPFCVQSATNYNVRWSVALEKAPAFNEISLDEAPLGQLDPYFHANRARSWVEDRISDMPDMQSSRLQRWSKRQVLINSDLTGTCNAFYSPNDESLNFYQATQGCNNSGRAAKVVYHEYGHSVHDHLTANASTFDGQLSEGISDYISATITNDPNMTGLMDCHSVLPGYTTLRTCVNNYTYCSDPRKCNSVPQHISRRLGEVHNAAPVICGALWDLRTNLVKRYGEAAGVEKADQLFLRFLRLATDMNSSYTAAIAADEDDDNNPRNGTVHSCEINRAFLGTNGGTAHFPDAIRQGVPCK